MEKSILDHRLISKRYFFPRKTVFDNPFWVDCKGARLACHYQETDPRAKTLIHFHGSGEVVSDNIENFVPIIVSMGYNCFLAEYRGYGMSTGKPGLVRMLGDVERIIQAIGQPTKNLILFGRSLGSIYSIHAAHRFPDMAGLIIESGIANPLKRLLSRVKPEEIGVTREMMKMAVAKEINNQRKLANFNGPLLIMHTENDGMLDISHAKRLDDWARGPTTLKIFEHGDHNTILFLNFHEYFEVIQKFLRNL